MLVVKTPDRIWMDLDALAMFTGRKRRTIRKHCQPTAYVDSRKMYDAKQSADILALIPQRG